MNDMVRASTYLKGILPLMEDLVEYDQAAAAAIAGQDLVLQFEVKDGPIGHLEIREGKIRHGVGRHPHPDVRLTFKTPGLLNRLFDGEDVRPGIRKGFTRLGFLTKTFPILAERLEYYMEGEGQNAKGPEANLFLVKLGLHAMLGGMTAVAADDPSLADVAAATPAGTLLVTVLPDGPQGTFAKVPRNGGYEFVSTWGQPVEQPNAVMEFTSLDVARRLIDGQLSAVVAIGTGEMRIRGHLPLIDKVNVFLTRLGQVLEREPLPPEAGEEARPALPGPPRYKRSVDLFVRAARVIPEGIYGHKNPAFLLPGHCPYYAERAEGGHCWDVDGNEYVDFLCGYGPIILGHNHPQVEEVVRQQMAKGSCFNHPGEAMVQLAERLVNLISGGDWAVFAKNGSDVTTWAVRVAREHTRRKKIVMVRGAYHGVHAWCTAYPGGVLPDDKDNVLKMGWNRLDELEALVAAHRGQIAGLIATPYHHRTYAAQQMPADGFWPGVRQICDREGMLLILDDIRAGFRLDIRGSHVTFGIEPDLLCFGKAMANGHPIAVAMGREGLRDAAEAVFLSGTFWFSPVPMIASLTTLRILEEGDAIDHMARLGARLKEGLQELGAAHGYRVTVSGPTPVPYLTFDDDPDLYHMQVFCREMIARGVFLHPHHNWFVCAAHTDADVDYTLEVADQAFALTRKELD
ncbi:MAG: aminotransferase class III-fold pyridoxal phosphate-dependent enzyme [Anaerolineae bacterium]|jgi:glutamate-1-semialdehyde 2,1-aminomutase